ncbi:MAG: nucleotide exchange factor GrpE [Thermoanaerobaculia bacterium]
MTDDERVKEKGIMSVGDQEFELDPHESENLEAAMREALEAVEHVSHKERDESGTQPIGDGSVDETASMADYEVRRLQDEIADLRDRSVRTLADFDNYRKRIERERNDERRYSAFESLRDFLGVIDNLERALAAEGSAEDLKTGIELIHRQMLDLLGSHGVARVEAEGEPFNPAVHDAVSRHEDPNVEGPTVSAELQSGYTMHKRLLRPAVVRVAMPPETAAEKAPRGAEEEQSTDD